MPKGVLPRPDHSGTLWQVRRTDGNRGGPGAEPGGRMSAGDSQARCVGVPCADAGEALARTPIRPAGHAVHLGHSGARIA